MAEARTGPADPLLPVPIPDAPSAVPPDLGRAVVGFFESARHHPTPKHPAQEVALQLEEMARASSRRLLGALAGRPGDEVPVALLGSLYRSFGSRVRAWKRSPGRSILQVDECGLRQALGLVGMDCRGVCARVSSSALGVLPERASVLRSPKGVGCFLTLQVTSRPPSSR